MAAAKKIITLDLGTSTIKFAEFALAKGGALTLLRFGVAELGMDPNKEEERSKFIEPTLSKLFKDHGVKAKGAEVLLSISGQSVFMRFVKLPPVDPTQVDQVVAFEAQQNVPFPIAEVTWDYQMMPNRGSGTEAEAVIVAIKKEVLEAEVAAVESTGVVIKQVDVAPFALLNSFRYSEPMSDDTAIIIDMGARSTNLIFVEKSSFWIRNIPIAGNQISQSICNELQEPFAAAEILKKGKGFVSLGGVYADPDDADAARISKLIRSTLTRLHVDINRSIAFYRTTLGGSAPKRVFLTGGSSQLPYLDLFIADKLNLPVTYFNPLRNVNLSPNLPENVLQQNHCYSGELVGLALRQTGSCPAEVMLDAPSLIARADKARKLPFYFTALGAWTLLFVIMALFYYQQSVLARQVAAELNQKSESLKLMAPAIGKLAKQADALQGTFDTAVELGVQRDIWPQILNALNEKITDGMWITELTPKLSDDKTPNASVAPAARGTKAKPDQITWLLINGFYHDNEKTQKIEDKAISAYVDALAALPLFDIDTNKRSETQPGQGGKQDVFAQDFTLHLKLKTPISLKP